jgi:hypothetical protein
MREVRELVRKGLAKKYVQNDVGYILNPVGTQCYPADEPSSRELID